VPPRGPSIDVIFKLGGGRCQTHRQHPSGGPPSTSSSTLVVDAAGPAGSTPKGPATDIIFRTQWWMLPDPPAAPPSGTAIDVLQQLVVVGIISTANASHGATGRLSLLHVLQAKHFARKKFGSLRC
jgi:hypothetical protein